MKFKKLLALVIASIICFSLAGCSKNPSVEPSGSSSATVQDTDNILLNSPLIPDYEHYDPTNFYSDCEKLAAGENSSDNIALYDSLYADFIKVKNYIELTNILSCENIGDSYYAEEKSYCTEIFTTMKNKFACAVRDALKGPTSEALKEHIGYQPAINNFENYEEKPEKLATLLAQEDTLEKEYEAIWEDTSFAKYEYNGETYTYDDIIGEKGDLLFDEEGYDVYIDVYAQCLKLINEKAGNIYLQLLSIRNQIAKLCGYETYSDYADKEVFSRNYADDLPVLIAAAKEIGYEYYYDYLEAENRLPELSLTAQELLETCKTFLAGISPYVDEAYDYFLENKLYSIGSGDERTDIALTSEFINWPPVILYKQYKQSFDLFQMAHEMGHYIDCFRTVSPDPVFNNGDYAVFEIHSTGLQLLSSKNVSVIFPDDYDALTAYDVLELLSYITDGCIVDEFERTVYSNPDMTLDEINQLYLEINACYDTTYPGQEYEWIYTNHIFTLPQYYANYAASGFASLQLYLESLDDYEGAVSKWESIIDLSGYEYSYSDVLELSGLHDFSDKTFNVELMTKIRDYGVGLLE